MRLLHASDLHGHRPAYDTLFAAAEDPSVDAVVLAGDLLPHPHDRDRLLEGQVEFVQGFLTPALERLARARPSLPVLAVSGNDDWAAAVEVLKDAAPDNLRWLSDGPVDVQGLTFAGGPWVPITPFFMKDFDRLDHEGWTPAILPKAVILTGGGAARTADLAELEARPTIAEELARLRDVGPPENTVLVVHTPPARTLLDVMRGGVHIGSEALRAFIEEMQPLLTLHGHVHESPSVTGAFEDRIGQTVCVNAGASLSGLRALVIEVAPGEVASVARR